MSFERALERVLHADEYCVPARGVQWIRSAGLSANPDPLSNATARSRKRNPQRGTDFVMRGVRGAPDGIYKRTGSRAASPVMIFTRPPIYRKRFPFYETAEIGDGHAVRKALSHRPGAIRRLSDGGLTGGGGLGPSPTPTPSRVIRTPRVFQRASPNFTVNDVNGRGVNR
jgi:hypothetical protein